MSSKKISNLREGIRKRMGEPPTAGFLADMLEQQPLRASMIRLTLNQILRYERNPRKFGNPEYEAIKESIRQRGLDQPLAVTQRPGESHYILKKGAGTRLQALEELWQETGDKKYFEQECIYEPYKDELDLFVGHGIENLKRSQMSFIETAFFYMELRQLHEDIEGRELSTREACERINLDGFSVDHSRLIRYRYGVELYRCIPKALEGGLSQRGIEQIRQQERAYRTLWERHSDKLDMFATIWQDALLATDDYDGFDITRLQSHVEQRMAGELNINPRHLTAEVDLLFNQPDPDDLQSLMPMTRAINSPSSLPVDEDNSETDIDPPAERDSEFSGINTNDANDLQTHQTSVTPSPAAATTAQKIPRATSPKTATAADQRSSTGAAPAPLSPTVTPIENSIERSNLSIAARLPDNHTDLDSIVAQFDQFVATPHPHDGNLLFAAIKPAVSWARAIFSSFPQADFLNPEPGRDKEPVGLRGATPQEHACYRLELFPLRYQLTGSYLMDYVWWRTWKAIHAPYLDEDEQLPNLAVEMIGLVFNTSLTAVEMDLRSPILFSDPACEWIDWPLQQMERSIREFHQLRRRIPDNYINPLGVQS